MILLAEDRKAQGRRFYGTRLVNENDTYIIHFCSQLRNKSFVPNGTTKTKEKSWGLQWISRPTYTFAECSIKLLISPTCWRTMNWGYHTCIYDFCHITNTYISTTHLMFFFIMLVHLVQKHQLAVQSSAIDHKEQSATQSKNKKINYRSKLLNTKQLTVMACVQNCVLAEYLLVYTVTGCIY